MSSDLDRVYADVVACAHGPKPNFTQIQLRLEEIKASFQTDVAYQHALRDVRHAMEKLYNLETLDGKGGFENI